jgi:hypothetical protein
MYKNAKVYLISDCDNLQGHIASSLDLTHNVTGNSKYNFLTFS